MNDDELNTSVRERFTGVRMDTPVDDIIARGRAVRARRRIPVAAGTLAATAGATLGIAALLPPAHSPRAEHQPTVGRATLDAYSVVSTGHGNYRVTVRALRDPAGLQKKLREDGIPARISYSNPKPPVCRPAGNMAQFTFVGKSLHGNPVVFVIHRSELGHDRGVFISIRPARAGSGWLGFWLDLVHKSPACTG